MTPPLPFEDIAARVGSEIGRSHWLRIDQERIDAFAACTDDRQWIHVDPARAAGGPYGTTVAHGLLIVALIPHLSENVSLVPEGAVATLNYGINRVRFITPVPVGSEIRDAIFLAAAEDRGNGRILLTHRHTIEIRGQVKPACVVEMLRMFVTVRSSNSYKH
jgi:acyl dehydratase